MDAAGGCDRDSDTTLPLLPPLLPPVLSPLLPPLSLLLFINIM